MLQFAFVAVLALLPISNLSMELSGFPFGSLQDARLGNFQELCKWFCGDQYYHDYSFRTLDDVVHPRILCGLCKKKFSTTTTPKTTATTSSTTKSSTTTKPPSTTSAPTSTTSTTMGPTTTISTTAPSPNATQT